MLCVDFDMTQQLLDLPVPSFSGEIVKMAIYILYNILPTYLDYFTINSYDQVKDFDCFKTIKIYF